MPDVSQGPREETASFLGAWFDGIAAPGSQRTGSAVETETDGGDSSKGDGKGAPEAGRSVQQEVLGIGRKETEEEEVARLLTYHGEIRRAEAKNANIQSTLRQATLAAGEACTEVEELLKCLEAARSFLKGDSEPSVFEFARTKVELPLFADIYHRIPLLAYQDQEIEELRALTSTSPGWGTDEVTQLREAVKKECSRVAARRLAASGSCSDPLSALSTLDEEDLLLVSYPRRLDDDELEDEEIDWDFVARELQYKFNAEQCRTRWLQYDAPNATNGRDWTDEELKRLLEAVEMLGEADWEAVAEELSAKGEQWKRSAMACFCAYQSHDDNPANRDQAPVEWSTAEDVKLLQLDRIWDRRGEIVAEKLGTSRSQVQVNSHIRVYDKIRAREDDATLSELEEAASDPAAKKRMRRAARSGKRESLQVTKKAKTQETSRNSRWSAADEEMIVTILERTGRIKEVAKHFSGRSRTSCAMKWHSLKTKAVENEREINPPKTLAVKPLRKELRARILSLIDAMSRDVSAHSEGEEREVEDQEGMQDHENIEEQVQD